MKNKRKIIVAVTIVSVAVVVLLACLIAGYLSQSDNIICFHKFDEGKVIEEPNCTEEGKIVYTCTKCGEIKEEAIDALGHALGEWKLYRASTPYEEGEERAKCQNCIYYSSRKLDKISADKHIAIDDGKGNLTYFEVEADGSYTLPTPERVGYIFRGFVDADGKSFAASGKISGPVHIRAEWEIEGTDTLAELIERAAAGAEEIMITADITVTEPVFFVGRTHLFADGNYTLKRAKDYDGDIFVVGQNKDGVGSPMLFKETVLILGGGKGTLTIDGNKDNLSVKVVGSALFVSDSATVDLYDGIVIANNKKLGNSRIESCEGYLNIETIERAGGAAILLVNGTVNMHGGIIENNMVMTEGTVVVGEDGTETVLETAGCGGAIYNRGNFNMFGGIIRNSEGYRGGAIYNDEIVWLVAGTIANNKSYTYGGGVSSSSSAEAQMFIGSDMEGAAGMVFEGNFSLKAGGVLYSNTNSPIVIYGNTAFYNNSTDSSGGAIYTGGALTVRGATFVGNTCRYSGGAIYHHFSNPERERRNLELTDCIFELNSASLGGAVMLSAKDTSVTEGTYAEITNCQFNGNTAVKSEFGAGNGGAIYTTRHSDASISKCVFNGNTASTNAGALSIHTGSTVRVSECGFNENSATFGGAMYLSSDSKTTVLDSDFNMNAALKDEEGNGGNGGAIWANGIDLTVKNTKFRSNSAENHAGAIYQSAMLLSLDSSVSFEENSAGNHGGAIYMTYTTNENGIRKGSVLRIDGVVFSGNSALSGGAISARSESLLLISGAQFMNNSTPDAISGTVQGGGAIYANNSRVDVSFVSFDGNFSGYYGGAVKLDDCETVIENVSILNSTGGTGGALFVSGGEVEVEGLTLSGNEAKVNGVVYMTKITATLNKITAENNSASNGGVLYASKSAVIDIVESFFKSNSAKKGGAIYTEGGTVTASAGNEFTGNTANYGGAIMAINAATVNISGIPFVDNEASVRGGAIAIEGSVLNIGVGTTFEGNASGSYGGAVSVHDYTETVEVIPEGETEPVEETVTVDAILTVDGAVFKNNTSLRGGAIYVSQNEYSVKDAAFESNSATDPEYGGGAIYNTGAIGTLANVTFTGNTSHKGGAVALHSESEMTVTSMTAAGNTATANEEDKVGLGGAFYVNNSTLTLAPDGYGTIVFGSDTEGSGNSAVNGGAICAENKAILIVSGAEFIGNSALRGGAINLISGCTASFTGTKFTSNSATGEANYEGGGAINAENGTLILSGVIMDGNTSAYYGGAINARKGEVIIKNNTVITNSEGSTGAALYFRENGTKVTITNSTVSNTNAKYNGAIYMTGKGELTVDGLVAEDNAANQGGVFYVSGGTVTLNNVTARGNSAKANGGAIYVVTANMTVNSSVFEENTSKNGGAIFATKNANLTVLGTSFTVNEAECGGAIYIEGATVEIGSDEEDNKTLFEGNNATELGGAIYVGEYKDTPDGTDEEPEIVKSTVTVDGAELVNNTASTNGGAICVESEATLNVSNTAFNGNSASTNGGAIYTTKSTVNVNNSTFEGNGAGNYGGAITSFGSVVTVTGDNTLFKNNSAATHGGAIYASYSGSVYSVIEMTDGRFEGNTAMAGGALSSRTGCTSTFTDTVFVGNEAKSKANDQGGGAIYTNNNTLTLSGVTLDGNSSAYYGGAISALGATIEIKNNSIITNNKGETGAAIHLRNGGSCTITDSTVSDNTATNYGTVYMTGIGMLTVNGLAANGNKAVRGGVFYVSGGTTTITNVTASDNFVTNGGELLYAGGSSTTVTVNYKTEEEKTSWKNGTYNNGATIVYKAA